MKNHGTLRCCAGFRRPDRTTLDDRADGLERLAQLAGCLRIQAVLDDLRHALLKRASARSIDAKCVLQALRRRPVTRLEANDPHVEARHRP
jgi:hypothetical protein